MPSKWRQGGPGSWSGKGSGRAMPRSFTAGGQGTKLAFVHLGKRAGLHSKHCLPLTLVCLSHPFFSALEISVPWVKVPSL